MAGRDWPRAGASAYFVTGSGTDVGKTFITARLIGELRARGRQAVGLKPVLSGYDPAQAAASDAGILAAAMGRDATAANIDALCPLRFAAPLSPDMAARREGRSIDFEALIAFCQGALGRGDHDLLFIEGVGGVMVPLDAEHLVLDWMRRLQLPVLLVTGSYLGSISHTLTAAQAVTGAGLGLSAIVISESAESSVDLAETRDTLRRFVGGTPVVTVPRDAGDGMELAVALAMI
ncbi:MAG: dethiobiotin synthase [Myxococcales bacterium]|nr:dethiobiotin synthase [Myxococcales bacterium]